MQALLFVVRKALSQDFFRGPETTPPEQREHAMVMARCRECGTGISAEDAECPHCGAIRPVDLSVASGWSDEPAAAGTPGKIGIRRIVPAVAVVAVVVLALVLAFTGVVSVEAMLMVKVVVAAVAAALIVWWVIIRAQESSERASIRQMGRRKPLDAENSEDENAT
jgi:hypothetical protein